MMNCKFTILIQLNVSLGMLSVPSGVPEMGTMSVY